VLHQSPTKTPTIADDATAIHDTSGDEDDSKSDEDSEARVASADVDSNRWHHSQKSKHLVLLDLLALLMVTETKPDVAATVLVTNGSMKFFYSN